MGLISRVISYVKTVSQGANVSDVKHDPGGGANQTGRHFQDPNTDSAPLPGDYLVTVHVQQSGSEEAVAYLDPSQAQTAQPGENRTYSRNGGGTEVAQVYLKNDGTIEVSNDSGSVTLEPSGRILAANRGGFIDLQAGGTVDINGFTIDPSGAAQSPVSVTAPTVSATTALTKAGVPVADQDHDHDAGTLIDSQSGSVTGTTAASNG